MSNIIEFVIKAQDVVSGQMQKIASTAQGAFSKIDAIVTSSQNRMRGYGISISGINSKLDELTKKRDMSVNTTDIRRANREIAELERRAERLQNIGVNKRSGGMSLPGWLAAGALAATVGAGAMGVITAGAKAQQDLIGLSTFLGKQKAQETYSNIQADAASTPFGTKGLLSANRMLISTGMAADIARKDVLSLANAIAATGGGDDELARMAQNMQQIKNAGKAEAVDIKQFGFAGINIYQLLADATGKTVKQTKDMVVSYDLLSYALRKAGAEGGIYAGALDGQSKSISGKWSTLMDNIDIASAKIGMSQSEGITGLIDKLIDLTNRIPAMAEQWVPAINAMTTQLISFVGTLIDMAKWLYHNWGWIKYVAVTAGTLMLAFKTATAAIAVYNTIMEIAAIRATALVIAEEAATVATSELGLAMMATPWGAIAAGIGLAAGAYLILTENARQAQEGTEWYNEKKKADAANDLTERVKNFDNKIGTNYGGGYVTLDTTDRKALFDTYDYVHKAKGLEGLTIDRFASILKGNAALETAVLNGGIAKNSNAIFSALDKAMGLGATKRDTSGNTSGLFEGAVEEKGSSITGGGKRSISFNFKNVVETMINQGASVDEVISDMKPKLEVAIYELLGRVPA